jgi:hypothetical protein
MIHSTIETTNVAIDKLRKDMNSVKRQAITPAAGKERGSLYTPPYDDGAIAGPNVCQCHGNPLGGDGPQDGD